ncbi:serine proteinase stubble isoform X1 [Culex quinquefasciatus]|nr:serine proteinase stubble isoform X1 [Culex quinquefasciatus]
MKLLIVTFLLVTTASKSLQKTSPCPTVFSYDEKEDTSETWYGTLRLKTNVPLHGIFIDVIFDGQVFVFGAYFKDVTTKDNLRFHIEDKTYRLNAGETLILKFYVKHSDYGRIPLLRQVRFNGQNVCVDVSTPKPPTERTAKPVVVSLQDHPIVYPEYSSQRETRPAVSDNTHDSNAHSVQPINYVVHANTNIPTTTVKPNLTIDSPYNRVDTLNVESRFSEPSNTSNEHSSNRKRPAADHHDPIQDPTIWKKPSSGSSSTETSTARTIRQPNPSYESSNQNVNYANVRTPAPAGSREGAYRTTTDAYYGGDYTQQPARTTTKKSGYFQGDYAFIQNVETSTHYINSYDEDICGTVVPKANPLVTHGAPAQNAQFPWHGALYRSSVTELRYLCGSTLISARYALTAAHCVALEKSLKPVESDSLLLYLGKTNLKKWTGPEQDAKLERIIIHPDYNYERFFADIALLRLKDDVKFNHFVRPACLWNFDEDYKVMINKVGFVPGWGYTERGLVSEELSFAQMPVVAHETCIWSNRDFFSKVTSNTSFCAGFRNGTSVCNGDSGGGMVFKQSNKWYLRGIVSVSAALQNHVSCDPNHFAVFTDVAKFLRWIRSYM